MSKIIKLYMLNIYRLLDVNYTSVKNKANKMEE